MLAVYDLRNADKNFDVIDYNNPDMIFLNVFKSLLKSIVSGKKGDALEAAGTS